MAGYLAGDVDEWIYIDIDDQHPDSIRFVKDCESVSYGQEIIVAWRIVFVLLVDSVQIMDLRPVQIG